MSLCTVHEPARDQVKKQMNRGPRPPRMVASMLICCLDQYSSVWVAYYAVVVEVARGEVTSQTCQHIFECLGGTNKGCSEGFTELLHRYRTFVRAYWYKKYYFMCSRSQDNKCTCIYSSAGSNSPSSTHIMTRIFALYFIFGLWATREQRVASRNGIYLGAFLLTFRTRHFPLS